MREGPGPSEGSPADPAAAGLPAGTCSGCGAPGLPAESLQVLRAAGATSPRLPSLVHTG